MHGSDEEVDDPPEVDSDDDLSDDGRKEIPEEVRRLPSLWNWSASSLSLITCHCPACKAITCDKIIGKHALYVLHGGYVNIFQ